MIEADNPGNGWFSDRMTAAGVSWERARLGFLSRARMRSPIAAARWSVRQAQVARQLRAQLREADLVYVNGFTLIGAAAAARLRRRRVLMHVHEIPPTPRAVGRAVRAVSTMQVCVSQAVANALGLVTTASIVVYNGVPIPLTAVVQRESTSAEPCRLGIVARINRWKGHLVLAQAFRELVERGMPVELHIVGAPHPSDTTTAGQLKTLLAGLGDAVVWAGEVTDGAAYMSNLHVLVAPSLEPDPFPITVLEGMARGLAVVASNTGGHPEAIVDGESGLLVAPSDVTGLAGSLESLARDAGARTRLGMAARARCESRFSAAAYRANIVAAVQQALVR
jgi:glycosyltransferase involved in cell wall biosynthesis